MTVLETAICDITAPLITLCSYRDSGIEKDELGISRSFNSESLLYWSLQSDAITPLLQNTFFFLNYFNNRKAMGLYYLLNSHLHSWMNGEEYFTTLCPDWKRGFVDCRDQSKVQNWRCVWSTMAGSEQYIGVLITSQSNRAINCALTSCLLWV